MILDNGKKKVEYWFDLEMYELYDGNEGILVQCCEKLEKENKIRKKCELEDGNDEMLENMIHFMQRSKKEMKRSHLLAKIRLIENRMHWKIKWKSEMADYFFDIELWPT